MPTQHKPDQLPTDEEMDIREVEKIFRQMESEAKRMTKMAAKTAEFLGEDDGDIIFA